MFISGDKDLSSLKHFREYANRFIAPDNEGGMDTESGAAKGGADISLGRSKNIFFPDTGSIK